MAETEMGAAALDSIYADLNGIFRDVFDDDTIVVKRELTADDVAEWDSLNHVRLVLAVQKHFNAKFSAAEISGLKNVGDLAKLIQAKAAPR